MGQQIHQTAIIEPGARIGSECEILAHAIITRHVTLEAGVVVHPFSVVGGDPQYLAFERSTQSGAVIGAGTVIRELVTVNRSIREGGDTVIGDHCFLMATSHVAHDCIVGREVVLANGALLAGHVEVGDHAFLGGGAAVHQYCRIGEGAMVAGHASITRDVPPFVLVAERDELSGLNTVGLRRRGVPRETIAELKEAYRGLFLSAGNPREKARELLQAKTWNSPESRRFLEFFLEGKRGFARVRHSPKEDDD